MLPYPINLLLLVSSLVTAAPAPQDITTYNPTKEASCLVKWDIQTQSDTTEHYEVTGQCMFLDSVDKVCSGGYRAPGFCPDGMLNLTYIKSQFSLPPFFLLRFFFFFFSFFGMCSLERKIISAN